MTNTRLSVQAIDAIEADMRRGLLTNAGSLEDDALIRLIAEIRSAWAESEALKEALRALLAIIEGDHSGEYAGGCERCDAVVAARALVGSVPQTPPAVSGADQREICPVIIENDDSIGGEGEIRCNRYGEFADDRTSWTCADGHVIDEPAQHCIVGRCPCRRLARGSVPPQPET